MRERDRSDRRMWLGLIFVIIGGVWLLDNLNIIPAIPRYLISWQSFLIVIGIFLIMGKGKVEPGLILIGIGSVFLLDEMNIIEMRNIWHIFWPLIIIAVGISLILRRNQYHYSGGRFHRRYDEEISSDEKKNDLVDYIDDFTFFGGREISINSQQFKGGKITAMFGGASIDMRNADLAPGTHKIDVFAMFGGASLIVPPDWTIKVEVFSLLGGFNDRRNSSIKVVPNQEKVLIVTGFVMFGGGDIKLNR